MGMFFGLIIGTVFGLVIGAYAGEDIKYIIGQLTNKR